MKKSIFFFSILLMSFFSYQASFSQEKKTDNELVNDLIAKKKEFNKKFKYGYRIQLYNGFEVEAKKTEAKFKIDFPKVDTFLTYVQPEWKIQIGFYKTKLEADRALLEFKQKYPGAIAIPLGK
jgi:hypothetical protein